MTQAETAAQADKLEKDLIALSRETIGLGNYQKIMRRYQELLLGVIRLLKEVSTSTTKQGEVKK